MAAAAQDFKLLDAFRSKISKIKDKGVATEAGFDVGYSTGFLGLDYLNGTTVKVNANGINVQYDSIGLVDGSANTFIGRSNCGKSTLVIQIIGNIIRKYDKAVALIDDIEGSLPAIRKEFLLQLTGEELKKKVNIRNFGITTENVYMRIRELHDLKMENRSEFEYDTGLYDTDGKRIFKLYPSCYMIDSLPMLMPDDIMEKEELTGGMGATAIAKQNTQLVKKMVQLAKEANIMLFTINHILDEIETNPYARKQATVAGLNQGERLPGGKAAVYLANNMFRIDDKITLKAAEGFGIDGSICYLKIIKSRSNRTLRTIPLIFNKTDGRFDEVWSLLQLLKEEGKLMGAGAYMYIAGAPDVKFAQKNFKEKLYQSPELQRAFALQCQETLKSFLSNCQVQEFNEETFDVNSLILDTVA